MLDSENMAQATAKASKARAKVNEALALDRAALMTVQPPQAPGRAKPKASATTTTTTLGSTTIIAAAAATGPTSAVAPLGVSIATSANDDYEGSKVTKRTNRAEKDEERSMVADLDNWGVFNMPSDIRNQLDDEEDSF